MGKTKPTTRFRKYSVVGPKTGLTYEAEDIPEAGVLVVRGPGASAAFLRKEGGGFVFYNGAGNPDVMRRIVMDVAPDSLKKEDA